jgi:hypothetical protein
MSKFTIVLFILYFLPSLVASSRKLHSTALIIIFNLFLGVINLLFSWTIVVWVVLLAMSFARNKSHFYAYPYSMWPFPEKYLQYNHDKR